jgi:hypothetical protein
VTFGHRKNGLVVLGNLASRVDVPITCQINLRVVAFYK